MNEEYLVNVAYKEIFSLVGHGFDYQSLRKMSIELRRYFYHLLVEEKQARAKNQPTFQQPK